MRYTALVIVLVVGVGALGAWIHTQPSKAVLAVQTAMDRDDPSLLAPWLDLEALRSNIKNREASKLPGEMPTDMPGDGFGSLLGLFGKALADSVIGALVQGVATPEGVLAMLRGASASAISPEGAAPATPSERLFAQARTQLIGFDTYVVSAPMRGGSTLKLVFKRHGTRWLLSDLAVSPPAQGQPT